MNGWSFWIAQDDRVRTFDVFVSDFARAERMALDAAGGGTVDSYTRQSAERMTKVCRPGAMKEFYDRTPLPRRGSVKRGSRADTPAARASGGPSTD